MTKKQVILKEKREACEKFFFKLSQCLYSCYEIVGSCNNDFSRYLVPFGTEDQITYYSKPVLSFRMSDHWNWWANLKKCNDSHYVQCRCFDMPWVRERKTPGGASEPQMGIMIAVCDLNGNYHHVYGDKFDRKSYKWSWVERSPRSVIEHWLI